MTNYKNSTNVTRQQQQIGTQIRAKTEEKETKESNTTNLIKRES
jgi:hypothetical protein